MFEPSIEELILNGIIEVSGVDSVTGELLYSFTPKLKELMPDMWNERLDYIYGEIMFFWQLGFLDAKNMDTDNPTVRLTEKAFDEDEIAELPEERQESLREIKRLFER